MYDATNILRIWSSFKASEATIRNQEVSMPCPGLMVPIASVDEGTVRIHQKFEGVASLP